MNDAASRRSWPMRWYTKLEYQSLFPTHPLVEKIALGFDGVAVPVLAVLHMPPEVIPYASGTRARYRRLHDLFLYFGAWDERLYAQWLFCWKTVDASTGAMKPGTVRLVDDEQALLIRRAPMAKALYPAEEFPAGSLRTARVSQKRLYCEIYRAIDSSSMGCPEDIRLIWQAMKNRSDRF